MANNNPGLDDSPAGPAPDRKSVFLSHCSKDHSLAEELCGSLEGRGFACWIAPRDVAPGEPYALECLRGVAESATLLLLASEAALASPQVLSEVEQAHKRRKPIYTVLIPPAKVRGEIDFYLSRLHWIESAGRSAEDIAARLAPVLGKRREWAEVALPPGLRRTMQYRPAAFARMLSAVVLGAVLVLGGIVFALNHTLNTDFRRLGYVDLAASPSDDGRLTGQARVWLMSEGVPFAKVRLLTATTGADGQVARQTQDGWPVPEQVGSQQIVVLPLPQATRQVTTCLVVPSAGLDKTYRVTQRFLLAAASDRIHVSEIAAARVSKEDGSPCE